MTKVSDKEIGMILFDRTVDVLIKVLTIYLFHKFCSKGMVGQNS
jgi:hypothetical protein